MRTTEFGSLVSPHTLRRWIHEGKVYAVKRGGRWDVSLPDVLEVVSLRTVKQVGDGEAYLAYITTFPSSGRPSSEKVIRVTVNPAIRSLRLLLLELVPADVEYASIVGLFRTPAEADVALTLAWREWTYQDNDGYIQWK